MRRTVAGAIPILLLALLIAPAGAQNGSAWLDPKSSEPLESAGEVVLTVSLWRAGRVAYRTYDGACAVTYSPAGTPPDVTCGASARARAPKDYTATSGELVFTEVEGSKTIKIPIVDDELAEGNEAFTLAAWEEANADPWIDRGDSVIVHITDDDETDSAGEFAGAATRTPTSEARPQSSGSATGASVASGPATAATSPSSTLDVALAAEDLRRGPGFVLTSEGSSEPAARRGSGAGRSASGMAFGLGAVAVGSLALVRRRRRWSPTRA
jgi:hypothetical protein